MYSKLSVFITLLLTVSPCLRCDIVEPLVVVHGGAEEISPEFEFRKVSGVKKAAHVGYKVLQSTKNVLDAVEEALKYLELDESFNAGFGSALNAEGDVEMDASIMEGATFKTGAVGVVKDIAHPINLARFILDRTPHTLLSDQGALRYAKAMKIPTVRKGSLNSKYAEKDLQNFLKCHKHKTVGGGGAGAIAIDANGHIAVGSSSGGCIGKMPGRTGPEAIIGAGIYVDDTIGGAVVTGHGDSIIRSHMAGSILQEIRRGKCARSVIRKALKSVEAKFNNSAGAIVVTRTGEVVVDFNTETMPWAYQIGEEVFYGLRQGESNRTNTKEMLVEKINLSPFSIKLNTPVPDK